MTRSLVSVALGLAVGCGAPDDREAQGDDAAELGTDVVTRAEQILFGTEPVPRHCASQADAERVRCLIAARYAADPAARDIALAYFNERGGLAGVGPAEQIDGGYRGRIQMVPELPIGQYRKHLQWTTDSMRDFDAFFRALERVAPAPIRYRWREVDFRFIRSVGRTTPSASVYRDKFEVFYNVSGSLHKSHAAVRDTLFHELFHVNEAAHGEWATAALAPIANAIAARCGTNNACLAPYAPTDTKYGGGVYYAFHPGNGPLEVEYSAELASRYFEEQRAMMAGERLRKPAFKCGPPENAQAWSLMATEFFGGADLVPACTR